MTELPSEIAILVQDVIGVTGVGPQTRLDGDLLLDSIELTLLCEAVQSRYGENADLLKHLTSLDIDSFTAFSVADVAAFVSEQRLR